MLHSCFWGAKNEFETRLLDILKKQSFFPCLLLFPSCTVRIINADFNIQSLGEKKSSLWVLITSAMEICFHNQSEQGCFCAFFSASVGQRTTHLSGSQAPRKFQSPLPLKVSTVECALPSCRGPDNVPELNIWAKHCAHEAQMAELQRCDKDRGFSRKLLIIRFLFRQYFALTLPQPPAPSSPQPKAQATLKCLFTILFFWK